MKRMILISVLLFPGCSLLEFNEGAADAEKRIVVYTDKADAVEPVIAAVEDITGPVLTSDQKTKAESVAGTVGTVAKTAGGIAAAIPGGQGVAAVLGIVGSVAGAIGTILSRRKTKAVAAAAVTAADALPGGGKAITDAAAKTGASDEIKSAYRATI